jgi:amino acid permease
LLLPYDPVRRRTAPQSRPMASFDDLSEPVEDAPLRPLGRAAPPVRSARVGTPPGGTATAAAQRGEEGISLWGSVVLTINNLAGPGMLALPVVYQQAGWLPATTMLVLFWLLSALAATCLCESIDILDALVAQHGLRYSERREFSNLVRFYFGDSWYLVAHLAFNLSMQSINVASIVVSAQALDNLFIFVFGNTYALQLLPQLDLLSSTTGGEDVFGGATVISLGYIVLLALVVPLGFLDLSENVRYQSYSFWLSIAILMQFIYHFSSRPRHFDQTPTIGGDFSQLGGVFIFSYAFTTLIPSWYNEKHPSVNTNKAMWYSTAAVSVSYFVMGLLAAWAYPHVHSDNILNAMSGPHADLLTKICVLLFSLGSVAPSIPVRSIMLRANILRTPQTDAAPRTPSRHLPGIDSPATWRAGADSSGERGLGGAGGGGRTGVGAGVGAVGAAVRDEGPSCLSGEFWVQYCTCSDEWATFWAVIFPWLFSFFFYSGQDFADFINWTSLTVNGVICFVVPFLVYLKARQLRARFLMPAVREEFQDMPLLEDEDGIRSGGDGGGGGEDGDEREAGDDDIRRFGLPSSSRRRNTVLSSVLPSPVGVPQCEPHGAELVATICVVVSTLVLLSQIISNLYGAAFAPPSDRGGE